MQLVVIVLLVIVVAGLAAIAWRIAAVAERVRGMERAQTATGGSLDSRLGVLYTELAAARTGVSELRGQAEARGHTDRQVAESVRRLEAVIAGTHSKGAAGENILNVVFSKLPAAWQLRDFRVGNRTVEFALKLPNGRVLPIDSKWPATDHIERLAAATDPLERQQLKDAINRVVLTKAREVKKYLEPSLTLGFAIAAVPDAVYDVSTDVHAQCLQENVVLLGYSMFLPYVLLVFQTVLATSRDIDLEKLAAHLRAAELAAAAVQEELEGRFSRALAMLHNSKTELSAHASRISSSLTHVQIAAPVRRAS